MTTVRTILRSFKNRLVSKNVSPSNVCFELDGRQISNPRLFRLTKTGNPSWVAHLDGRPVKIYECRDEEQATFIEGISNHSKLRPYLPTCLMRIKKYLLVDWIPGTQVTRKLIRNNRAVLGQIARLQALIHQQGIENAPDSEKFGYMDYLRDRLRKFTGMFPVDALMEIDEVLSDNAFSGEPHVSHPDLTLDNLIVAEDTGTVKIIDNESLDHGPYYSIDLLNTYKSFGESAGSGLLESYLDSYLKNGGDLTPLIKNWRFFDAMWTLRLIGSYLQAGAIDKSLLVGQRFSERRTELQPLIEFVKTRFG